MYYYSPFRNKYGTNPQKNSCPFCEVDTMSSQGVRDSVGILIENDYYRWVVNYFPKFEGHTMVVPKRHITTLGSEQPDEIIARDELITHASQTLTTLYPGAGVEIFLQTGEGSESSITHLHWHVVPALPKDPLRGFDKLGQFFTIEEGKERVVVFPVAIELAQEKLLSALATVLK